MKIITLTRLTSNQQNNSLDEFLLFLKHKGDSLICIFTWKENQQYKLLLSKQDTYSITIEKISQSKTIVFNKDQISNKQILRDTIVSQLSILGFKDQQNQMDDIIDFDWENVFDNTDFDDKHKSQLENALNILELSESEVIESILESTELESYESDWVINVKLNNIKTNFSWEELIKRKLIDQQHVDKLNYLITHKLINIKSSFSDLINYDTNYLESLSNEQNDYLSNYTLMYFDDNEQINQIIHQSNTLDYGRVEFLWRSWGYLCPNLQINVDKVFNIPNRESLAYDIRLALDSDSEIEIESVYNEVCKLEESNVLLVWSIFDLKWFKQTVKSYNQIIDQVLKDKNELEQNLLLDVLSNMDDDGRGLNEYIDNIYNSFIDWSNQQQILLDNIKLTNLDTIIIWDHKQFKKNETFILTPFHYPYFWTGHKELIDQLCKLNSIRSSNDYTQKIYSLLWKDKQEEELWIMRVLLARKEILNEYIQKQGFQDIVSVEIDYPNIVLHVQYNLVDEDYWRFSNLSYFKTRGDLVNMNNQQKLLELTGIDLTKPLDESRVKLLKSFVDSVETYKDRLISVNNIDSKVIEFDRKIMDSGKLLSYMLQKYNIASSEEMSKILKDLKETWSRFNQDMFYYQKLDKVELF